MDDSGQLFEVQQLYIYEGVEMQTELSTFTL